MRNHFHTVLETPNANLVEGLRWFLSADTIRLNHRQKLFGHVFSGRYKALLVAGSGNGYLKTACDYVHLNPARAGLLGQEDRRLAYPWSSFGWYLAAPEHRPGWVRVDRLLGEHGIQADSPAGRQEFERQMERRPFFTALPKRLVRDGQQSSSQTVRTVRLQAGSVPKKRHSPGRSGRSTGDFLARGCQRDWLRWSKVGLKL